MDKRTRVLFVHVPQDRQGISFVNLIAVGIFGMADLLMRHGFQTKMLNTLVERIVDDEFRLDSFIAEHQYDVICLSLHWHYQAYNVIQAISSIKARCPSVRIVVGGYTASIFANEIMKDYTTIDYIIRGEAESPLVELLEHIEIGSMDLEGIPNLVWRDQDGCIRQNQKTWIADAAFLDSLNYTQLSLLRNSHVYVRLPETGIDPSLRYALPDRPRFLVSTGRGCPVQCFYCGGGAEAQQIITGRRGFVFRNTKRVLDEIRVLVESGIREIVLDYDPDPDSSYYVTLFRRIAAEDWNLSCIFGSWRLPTAALVDGFYASFRRVELLLSPDFGNDRIRKRNKGWYFSNDEVCKLLTHLDMRNKRENTYVAVFLYFLLGAPDETVESLRDTAAFIKSMRQFRCVKTVIAQVPQAEPGSPLARYCVVGDGSEDRNSFSGYLSLSKRIGLQGGNVDCKTLMGCIPQNLSVEQLSNWVEQANTFPKVQTEPIFRCQMESLDDRLGRSPRFELETWIQHLRNNHVVRHWSLKDQESGAESDISHLEALIYRYADGRRTIGELLTIVQELLLPVEPEASMKGFFEAIKYFISKGIMEIL